MRCKRCGFDPEVPQEYFTAPEVQRELSISRAMFERFVRQYPDRVPKPRTIGNSRVYHRSQLGDFIALVAEEARCNSSMKTAYRNRDSINANVQRRLDNGTLR